MGNSMMTKRRGTSVIGAGLLALAISGCSMGSMFGGGGDNPSVQSNAQLANSTATQAEIVAAQSNAMPAIATECPQIRVRSGGEALFNYGRGKAGTPSDLNYQAVIEKSSRNCVVSNGLITVRMGVVGRLLLGPAGTQTKVDVPIRFAVERNGQAVFSEKYMIPVSITPPNQSEEFVKVVENVAIPYLGGENITIWVGFDPRA